MLNNDGAHVRSLRVVYNGRIGDNALHFSHKSVSMKTIWFLFKPIIPNIRAFALTEKAPSIYGAEILVQKKTFGNAVITQLLTFCYNCYTVAIVHQI